MARDSFVRFVRNHAATHGHDFGQALIDSLSEVDESLQAVCATSGIDLETSFPTDAGYVSLMVLREKSLRTSQVMQSLIHGTSPMTDDAAAAQIREATDFSLQLMGASEAHPQVPVARILDDHAQRLLDCVLGLQGAAEAYDAGRLEGLRQRQSRPRTR
ncbi:MAG: hypothetical protein ABL967_01550 [Bryobacteraceae bacterium]